MKISYRNKKLERILSDERLIKKHYSKVFTGLVNRLTELDAVKNLSLISHNPPPRKHKLSGNYEGHWSVDVSKNYRLIFTIPGNGSLEEKLITEIIIEGIVDTH